MARSNWIDIQFQRTDSDDVRLEKLRRMAVAFGELARAVELTALQLTNDVTGTVTIANGSAQMSVTINDGAVTNSKLGDMPPNTLKGRLGGVGAPSNLTPAEVATILNSAFDHGSLQGLADDDHPQYLLRSLLSTQGSLVTRDATAVVGLPIGGANQLLRVSAGMPVWATISPTITLGTDLTGSITLTDLADGTLNATIGNGKVTNAKLADMAQDTFKGRASGAGTGVPVDLSMTQALAILGLSGAVYTPTPTIVTNLDSATAQQCQYVRVGSVVIISGRFTADPTAAGPVELGLTIPIASNFAAREDLGGVGATQLVAGQVVELTADSTNDRISVRWTAVDTTSRQHQFICMYRII